MTNLKATQNSRQFHRLAIRTLQILIDTAILIATFYFAYELRFEFTLTQEQFALIWAQVPFVLSIYFAAMISTGVYNFVWRYVGLREVRIFAFASGVSFATLIFLRLFLTSELQYFRIPISINIISTVFGFGGLFLVRIFRRILHEKIQKMLLHQMHRRNGDASGGNGASSKRKRVLLIGAGQAGVLAAKEIQNRGDLDIELIGFVDDDFSKHGLVISGIKIIGNTQQIGQLVSQHRIDHVIITIAHANRSDIARIVAICENIPVKVRIIPGLFELLEGKVEVTRIRDIEIEDLLGREKVQLDMDAIRQFLTNKRVMITGAGGSIGSELVRQVLRFSPEKIIMVERSEFAMYQILAEMYQQDRQKSCIPMIADIGDDNRMNGIFDRFRPHVVLHAAAHKHVPLMEFNPTEAIRNNSLATWKLASIAGEFGTDVFVLISTDKAVNPTSIMGASKRIAELLIQGLNGLYRTQYLAVRFGNVLGSSGSVIPIFKEQIRKGGPITVTHPEMTRYFMTIPEASQLVLQASTMGRGAEIFILDMGEPVKIVDLAETMIRLSGLKPNVDIQITFTGLRPGEKLFEELNTGDDNVDRTLHPKIFIVKIKEFDSAEVSRVVQILDDLSSRGVERGLREFIRDLLPESSISINEVTAD
ncbi:polysaccharide biosynthesis protein [bacterium]|nr:polysaccharide biosynthesis protein [candidate division CSSED10-310 bacterium]